MRATIFAAWALVLVAGFTLQVAAPASAEAAPPGCTPSCVGKACDQDDGCGQPCGCDDGDPLTVDQCDAGTCYHRPWHDHCAEAIVLEPTGRRVLRGDTSAALDDDHVACSTGSAPDVYYAFTLTARTVVTLQVTQAAFDARVGLLGSCTPAGPTPPGTLACAGAEPVETWLEPGAYWLLVDGACCGAAGAFTVVAEFENACDALDCDDDDPCTNDSCDRGAGACVHEAVPAGGACDDGDPCTEGEVCLGGACQGGLTPDCDDGVGSTFDECEPGVGCRHRPSNDGCDQAQALPASGSFPVVGTTADARSNTDLACAGVAPNAPEVFYGFTLAIPTVLSVALSESLAPVAIGVVGACEGAGLPAGDALACASAEAPFVGLLAAGAYHLVVDGLAAGEGAEFELDVGFASACTLLECDDDDPCTDDACSEATGACTHAPRPAGASCDDGEPCTTGEQCVAGACAGGQAVDCDDHDADTADSCEPGYGCLHVPSNDDCASARAIPAEGVQVLTADTTGASDDDDQACTTPGDSGPDLFYTFTLDRRAAVTVEVVEAGFEATVGLLTACRPAAWEPGDVLACEGAGAPPTARLLEPGTYWLAVDALCCDQSGPFEVRVRFDDPCTLQDCDDHDACTADACTPGIGACVHTALAEGGACEDGEPCTEGETCTAGLCGGGLPVGCADDDPATFDECEPGVGCRHRPPNDACAGAERFEAVGTATLSGDTTDARDDNPMICTTQGDPTPDVYYAFTLTETAFVTVSFESASYAATAGLFSTCAPQSWDPPDLVTCEFAGSPSYARLVEPGDYWLVVDGTCCGAAGSYDLSVTFDYACDLLDCDDGNACTDDACDLAVGCTHQEHARACSDGTVCTRQDVCAEGRCVGEIVDCDDDNPCTDDTCHPVLGCRSVANTAACDDDDACTTYDTCAAGACAGVDTSSVDCDDANPCTDDACDAALGCLHENNAIPCDDGNACTTLDACAVAVCTGVDTSAADCDDANACTVDTCDGATGCHHANREGACDDGNVCTTSDACAAGHCAGVDTSAVDCDDHNACTNDLCDAVTGCRNPAMGGPCDDHDACTTGDACAAGACVGVPKAPGACDDANPCTDDGCDATLGCRHVPNTSPCNDQSACTTGDICSGGACVGVDASAATCDDGDACTTDTCDAVLGCRHAPVAPCDDGNGCTDDACDPALGCVATPNAAPCTDGSVCTAGDACQGGSCLPGADVTARSLAEGGCDDGNLCTNDTCDAVAGCLHVNNFGACDDDDACTESQCQGGSCVAVGWVPGCCATDADCAASEVCDAETHLCGAGACGDCESDADCPAEGSGCVDLPSGSYCLLACAPGCPADTSCVTFGADEAYCVPLAGDCECSPHEQLGCTDGDLYWQDSCGGAEDLVQSCEGRGCVGWACCPEGTVQQQQACVVPGTEPEPEAVEAPPEVVEGAEPEAEVTEATPEAEADLEEAVDPEGDEPEPEDDVTEAGPEPIDGGADAAGDEHTAPDGSSEPGAPEAVTPDTPAADASAEDDNGGGGGGCSLAGATEGAFAPVLLVAALMLVAWRRRVARGLVLLRDRLGSGV